MYACSQDKGQAAKRPNLGTVMGGNGRRGKAWRDVNKQETGGGKRGTLVRLFFKVAAAEGGVGGAGVGEGAVEGEVPVGLRKGDTVGEARGQGAWRWGNGGAQKTTPMAQLQFPVL